MFQMPALVGDVVLDEELEGHWSIVTNDTFGLESLFRNPVDDGDENLVLGLPPGEQRCPGLLVVSVGRDPGILRVLGTPVRPFRGSADEALAVIGSGVEEMTEDLLARPSARAPRSIREGFGHGQKHPMDVIEIRAEFVG